MSDESNMRDVNPQTEGLPDKGRIIISLIAGGIALGIVTFIGMRIRPVGLAAGIFTFISGVMMLIRKRKENFKLALIVTSCGFLLLLANPRFGVVAGFAGYFLIVGAIGLVVFGLARAIKLAWDLGRFS